MTAWLAWLWPHLWPGWDAVWPNILASMICGAAIYFWKIRPHLKRQAERHEHVVQQLASLHDKHDQLRTDMSKVTARMGVIDDASDPH